MLTRRRPGRNADKPLSSRYCGCCCGWFFEPGVLELSERGGLPWLFSGLAGSPVWS
jgi:hypothetical protein